MVNGIIPFQKVVGQSLAEILGVDGHQEYEYTEGMVLCSLFSIYPERKRMAQQRLSQAWNTPVNVHTMQDPEQDWTWVYITFNNIEQYIFVGKYQNDWFSEPEPTPSERATWAREGFDGSKRKIRQYNPRLRII